MDLPQFIDTVADLGLPFGREDSAKLSTAGVWTDRCLLGLRTRTLAVDTAWALCHRLGAPAEVEPEWRAQWPRADVALFGIERQANVCTLKVYLEFWELVRQQVVTTRSRAPRLLNLGFKWLSGTHAPATRARYECLPLLTTTEILHRMGQRCRPAGVGAGAEAISMVRRAQAVDPREMFLYLECTEEGNPRCSFDVNLYKSGLQLHDVRSSIESACTRFGTDPDALWSQPTQPLTRRLGHLSGGQGRNGQEFLTIYFEIEPLP